MEQVNNENQKGGSCPMCNGGKSGFDCGCGYGHMHFHRHFLLRLILALIVVGAIFYMGVKVGEIRAELGMIQNGYHRHYEYMMPVQATPIYSGGGMMHGVANGSAVSSTPATK